jgi:IS1 family transposase
MCYFRQSVSHIPLMVTIHERSSILVHMNQLSTERRAQVLSALCEGNSIRSVTRMFSVGKNTVARLLVAAGSACAEHQDKVLRKLGCRRVQVDEIWRYVGAKDKNIPEERRGVFGIGSVWTWVALDADSKLVCSWMIGDRGADAARAFMQDLAGRLAHWVQLTSDGHTVYLTAVESAFGSDIDYAMLVKLYGQAEETETRYSPGECIGCERKTIQGSPDPKHVSTSYVERQNLAMRMHLRRFTRLTNGFSKKIDNHIAAVSLHFMYYNFVRIHQTLRCSPAMAAAVDGRLWSFYDIVRITEQYQERQEEENRGQSYNPFGPALGH